ncbi:MAG: hypothetical protein IPJ48_16355 [Propionivibrio sp.]|uniref:Uncharacterized protein n=1 Tax=Candidatus Propionivibrio dominans TaxID=2954373 RepID=A0A9D7I9U4_9RHOO|nr:hypothetical protein [Candidatus Propionivibrio dominans]
MSRLADEAMYFGAVADGVESQFDTIQMLKEQVAELNRRLAFNAKLLDENDKLREQLANALAANEHNLRVYHAAAAELRQQLSERDKQNLALKDALIKWRQQAFPGTDQRRVIERDFPTEPKP